MITTTNFRPHRWSQAYNPIVWSVTSNESTQVDFNYIFDIYINEPTNSTTYTYRSKQRPNPSGAGMIDVSSLVQSHIKLTNYSAEEGWGLNFRNGYPITGTVFIRVGEEYLTGGVIKQYDGTGGVGDPAYFLGPLEATINYVRILPAALDYQTHINNMSSATNYIFWDDYKMDGNGKFLSRDPGRRVVNINDRHTLSFINIPDLNTYNNSIQGIYYEAYNAVGVGLTSGFIQNTVANGGGPQTTATYTSITETYNTNFLTFKCGPKDLGLTSSLISSYLIQAYLKPSATSATTKQSIASEAIYFDIDQQCFDVFPTIRLSWLNDLGGRDYYNFRMFYEKTTTSSQDSYSQTLLNWASTTPVVYNDPNYATDNWLRGGSKIFNKVVNTTFSIETDWLTQEYVDFLGQIPESSSVWAYIGTSTIPVTINITNQEYTYKNINMTNLVQAKMECIITKVQTKQNL